MLTTVGLAGIADRQQQRERRITPVFDLGTVGGPLHGDVIGDGWDGRELRRVVLAATGPAAPLPRAFPGSPAPTRCFCPLR